MKVSAKGKHDKQNIRKTKSHHATNIVRGVLVGAAIHQQTHTVGKTMLSSTN
jgi:hypothetical protein